MNSKRYYKILGGNIPIMVSSPHSTATKRDGKTKDCEVMTGDIAILLNKESGVHAIIKNVESEDDPNYDKNSEYKKSLIGYIKRNGIKILLDIHGCSSDRDYDISIGTASQNGMDGLINGFKSVFKGYKIDINNDFKAEKNDTITKAISNATDCKCIQIEINKSLRKKDGDDFNDLVNTFVKFIKLQSMENLKESMEITFGDIRQMVLECIGEIMEGEGMDNNGILEWINSEIGIANEFLKDYGMSVFYNSKYNFDSYYSDCVAVYQHGSVKNCGKIRIGINIPLIQSCIKKNKKRLRKEIEVSVWHEIGHGIVEFLKGLRRKDTQCGTKIFRGGMLSDFRYIIDDEEYYVEEFGNAMASNGDGVFSSIGDFLDNYSEQILAIRNQEGGSKWLQHFMQSNKEMLEEIANEVGNEMLDRKACMEVYRRNRKLQQCGTFEQYFDYVSTIFPNSKMRNIVYHGSTFEFSTFEHGHYCTSGESKKNYYKAGFWFMKDKGAANFYTDKFMCFLKNLIRLKKVYKPTLYSVKLNIQNPKIIDREGGRGVDNTPVNDAFDSGNDSLVVRNVVDPTVVSDVYVVFDSRNIHILGNENDISGFMNFCRTNQGK